MILRVPSYYNQFHCIADKCRDSCCIGWEIDIDEDTFSYYKSIPGAFGERLKKNMVSEEENSFLLQKNGWCPFLNERKLCDICMELGEEALSEVCTEYPRFTTEYANVREKALCLSCEEVGRLVFSSDAKLGLLEQELYGDYEEAEGESLVLAGELEQARKEAIEILQDRGRDLSQRMISYLEYCSQRQKRIFGTREMVWDNQMFEENTYSCFLRRMELLEQLEVLDDEWGKVKQQLSTFFNEENYEQSHRSFSVERKPFEYEYEQLLVYFTFRYFMGAFYDDNLFTKAQFAVVSVLVIKDMDVARYFMAKEAFSLADRIDTARIYAKEVEHFEENMELLEKACLSDETFFLRSLKSQITRTM